MKFRTLTAYITPGATTAALVCFIGLSVVAYIYFVAASVLHVVVRQDAEETASSLQSDIAALETQLIAAQHEISSRLALLDGYNDDENKIFVVRGGDDVAFGTRRPE